jgi:hypothetical protein
MRAPTKILEYAPPTPDKHTRTAAILSRLGWFLLLLTLSHWLALDYAGAHRIKDWFSALNSLEPTITTLNITGIILPFLAIALGNPWAAIPSLLNLLLLITMPSYGWA